jgi:hypothetical protein
MKYKPVFSVTYNIVSNEGDFNESGFVAEDVGLRDAIGELFDTHTTHCGGVESIEPSDSDVGSARWFTVNNSTEYLTGECESRSLHLPKSITRASRLRLARLIGA